MISKTHLFHKLSIYLFFSWCNHVKVQSIKNKTIIRSASCHKVKTYNLLDFVSCYAVSRTIFL